MSERGSESSERPWDHDACISKYPATYQTESRFWTSPVALGMFAFLTLALVRHDSRFILPAMLVFLAKACFLISKWIVFLTESEDLQEVISISKGYMMLVWRHIAVFLDSNNDKQELRVNRFRKKMTAGFVLHFHQVQIFVLSRYLHRRNNMMKASEKFNLVRRSA